jgi:site-specific DNA-methyltransferase (adenine-specific)
MEYRSKIELHNVDCMEYMKTCKDNQFDLAIVDPPYGIGANKMTLGNGKNKIYRGENDWDAEIPGKEYWKELFRVSKNQIIWGGNYFTEYLKPTGAWVFWDKGTGDNDFADGELAWTSFKGALRKVKRSWVGANAKNGYKRIHPTEKPVELYQWLLDRYAEPSQTILDTHLGSGSIAIACDDMAFDLVGCEIDKRYFMESKERIENARKQIKMF